MSSIKLDTIIDEFPEERDAIERLAAFIENNARANGAERVFSMNRMFDVVHPSSQRVLVKMLMLATEYGYLEKVLRVTNGGHGGTDFKSLMDIPEVMIDRRGNEVEVNMDQISLMYKVCPTTNLK
jgi:hypothetical protein